MSRHQTRLRHPLLRRSVLVMRRVERLPATVRGLMWMGLSGLLFVVLNTLLRTLSLQLHPMQAQFLRYLAAVLVMLPLVARAGVVTYWPKRVGGQFARGGVHTVGLVMWFSALPHIPLADTTAIGFTGPIFIMLGAYLFFRETMRWERWLASLIGLAGVLVVVGPQLSGQAGVYNLLMLASSPVFAASFLITKALTRYERVEVIVFWQALSVTVCSVPMALWVWQTPSMWQWGGFLVAGLIGVAGHYSVTRGFAITDISSTQSVKFLELIWAACMGWLIFGDVPTRYTLVGGALISASTIWIAHRESKRR